MKKLIIIGIFVVGLIIGGIGHWFAIDRMPEIKAYQNAQKEQQRLEEMVCAGIVKTIDKNQLTMEITEKASDKLKIGEIVKVEFDSNTTYQQGMNFFEEPDSIQTHVKPGMTITVMLDNGKARVIHQEKLPPNAVAKN